ncbi:uncharacterized protein MYH16 isoform 2-T6 [Ciconia maguari]
MYTIENFELKTAYEESLEHLESVGKENKGPSGSNHQCAIESLQVSLETEVKGSAEALRLKKMDTDLTSMEMQLDRTNRNNTELVRTLNELQQHVKDLRIQTDEEAHQHEEELQEQCMLPQPTTDRAGRSADPLGGQQALSQTPGAGRGHGDDIMDSMSM